MKVFRRMRKSQALEVGASFRPGVGLAAGEAARNFFLHHIFVGVSRPGRGIARSLEGVERGGGTSFTNLGSWVVPFCMPRHSNHPDAPQIRLRWFVRLRLEVAEMRLRRSRELHDIKTGRVPLFPGQKVGTSTRGLPV